MNCKYKNYAKVDEYEIGTRIHLIVNGTNVQEYEGRPIAFLLQELEPDTWCELYNIINLHTFKLLHTTKYDISRNIFGYLIKWNRKEVKK